jgi:hypothetical protein
MHDLVSNYDQTVWDTAGPRVLTRCVALWSTLHPYMVRWIPVHNAGMSFPETYIFLLWKQARLFMAYLLDRENAIT